MKNEKVFITNSFDETQKVAENFIRRILRLQGQVLPKQALIIALYGDLGGGKTTFTQGVAKGLGIERRIISPTFIVLRTYKLKTPHFAKASRGKQNSKRKTTTKNSKFLYHIDLYRIENQNDIEGLGIEEILKNPENIVVIEWAERLGDLLPKERVDVYFEYISENKRKITFYE